MLRTYTTLLLVLGTLAGTAGRAHAQPRLPEAPNPFASPTSDTADAEWAYELTGKLSAAQAAYKDWQEGGLNSLSFTTSLDGGAEKDGTPWAQSYSLRLALGFVDQEEREIRKSEDLIRLQAGLQYQGDGFFRHFKPTVAGNLRTQFATGFSYSENPYPEEGHPRSGKEPPVQTSAFFAPATLTQALGLTYNPVEQWSLRLGAASKQTIVTEPDFRVLYGVDEDKVIRVEGGGQFVSALDQQLSENIRYRSQLSAFFAVNQLDNPPDVIFENVLNLQVNDWLSTDVEFVAMYDEDTVRAIQIKEVISVGVSVSLI